MVSERIIRALGQIEVNVGLIGEDTVHGDEGKVCEEFLFNTAFTFGMKIFDDEQPFANFVKFFDAPSSVVNVNQILFFILILIK